MWRLIPLSINNAYMNMAIDEAILIARMENKAPNTLRLYMWNPSAVSIGYFQDVSLEVNIDTCHTYGVDIVRRSTGGGAVYHDSMGELTYSVITDKQSIGVDDIISTYQKICSGIVYALEILGIKANFNPGNPHECPNITVNGLKISGNAQLIRGSYILQHGTILYDLDLRRMFTYLKISWAKEINDIIEIASKRLTCIKQVSSMKFSINDVARALIEGFRKTFKAEFTESNLTDFELKLVSKLVEKYKSESWLYHRIYKST
ncbi:MAG: biotin/lipoate A/B protein ligase family protein [Candidatus Methanomethylicia archaeon]